MKSLQGGDIETYANELFRSWKLGQAQKNDGVLLLVAPAEHKVRIEVGYGLEPILPDGFVGDVAVDMRPLLQQGRYGAAVLQGIESMGSRVAAAKHVSLDFQMQRPPENRPVTYRSHGLGIPFPLIIIGIVILLFLFRRGGGSGGSFITGMLLGNLLGGGGRGGWGGGGFGGFDGGGGGGGFGGFGGGDSGGGGASSGW